MSLIQSDFDPLFSEPPDGFRPMEAREGFPFPFEQQPCPQSKVAKTVKYVKSFGKKLRNFSIGRPKPEEKTSKEDYEVQYLALKKKEDFLKEDLERLRIKYQECSGDCNNSKEEVKRLKRELGDARETDLGYKVARKGCKKTRRLLKYAKKDYNEKEKELAIFKADIPNQIRFRHYRKYLENNLGEQFYISKLFYDQKVERKETTLERAVAVTANVVTFANYVLPGAGTAANVIVSVGNATIEYRSDEKMYKKSKPTVALCIPAESDESDIKVVGGIVQETSRKMVERFKDHLPLITLASLKKLAEYNVKQMFSYVVENHKEIEEHPTINLSSRFVLGTLYARKKWRQAKAQKMLDLENPQEKWPLMHLMRLTALRVEGREDLHFYPTYRYFVESLSQEGYSAFRYGLELDEEIDRELELWEDSIEKNRPKCPKIHNNNDHFIHLHGKSFIGRIGEAVHSNMPRVEIAASIVNAGLQLAGK